MGYGSVHERDLLIDVARGVVTGTRWQHHGVAEGDEFWSFQAPWSLPWGAREERCGYALVRAGVVVAWMPTLIQGVSGARAPAPTCCPPPTT